jgi:hypothetical protein
MEGLNLEGIVVFLGLILWIGVRRVLIFCFLNVFCSERLKYKILVIFGKFLMFFRLRQIKNTGI